MKQTVVFVSGTQVAGQLFKLLGQILLPIPFILSGDLYFRLLDICLIYNGDALLSLEGGGHLIHLFVNLFVNVGKRKVAP